jgi:transposase
MSKTIPNVTIGVDLGDRFSYLHVLDADGECVEEGRVRMTHEALRQRFEGLSEARVVLEAGTHSPWVSRLLSALGHEVYVANPRKLRAIYENDSKTDQVDAEYLARIGRLDTKLLAAIEHRGEEAQAQLAVIRSREVLVRTRTRLISHCRGIVKAMGGRLPQCSTPAFPRRVAEHVPPALAPALGPILEMLERINAQIRAYDREVERLAQTEYPETERMRQVTGVGALTALTFSLVIEDPTRFSKSRSVGAYLGLRPRRSDSGEREPQLRITKAGNPLMRRLLVQSAAYILGPHGPDCDLRRFGERIAARGGKSARKRARVAVARKLAVLLHRLWVSGEIYEPFRKAERQMAQVA